MALVRKTTFSVAAFSASPLSFTIPAPDSGNTLFLILSTMDTVSATGPWSASSVTDNGGSKWKKAVGLLDTTHGADLEIWWATNVTGAPTSISAVVSGSGTGENREATVLEFLGGWAFDVSASVNNGSGTSATSGTVSPAVANSLAIAAFSDSNQSHVITSPSGWTQEYNGSPSTNDLTVNDKIVGLGSLSATWTMPGGAFGPGVIAVFRPTIQKFYFHDATSLDAGTLPGATNLGSAAPGSTDTGATTNRSADEAVGALQVADTGVLNSSSEWHRRFLTAPLSAQSIGANNWTLAVAAKKGISGNDNYGYTVGVYVYRPSTGALVATIIDASIQTVGVGTQVNLITEVGEVGPIAGGAADLLDGDILVFEVWSIDQAQLNNVTPTFYYDGTTDPLNTTAASSAASYVSAPTPLSLVGQAPPPVLQTSQPVLRRRTKNQAKKWLRFRFRPPIFTAPPAVTSNQYTQNAVEDVSGIADVVSRVFTGGRVVTETVAGTDSVARVATYIRGISEAVTAASDSVTRAAIYPRAVSETGTVSDSVARTVTGSRSVTESVTAASDSIARVFTGTRTIIESITAASDAVTGTHIYSRVPTETLTAASDAVARVVAFHRSPAETITSTSDAIARQVAFQRAPSESISGSDTVARIFAGIRAIVETITAASDSVVGLRVQVRTPTETLTVATDLVSRIFTGARSVSETVATSDSPSRTVVFHRSPSEVISAAADVISRAVIFVRNVAETITAASDVVSGTRQPGRLITETVTAASDVVARIFTGSRSVAESMTVSDSAVRHLVAARALSETTTVTDSTVRAYLASRAVSETVPATSDSVVRHPTFARLIAETIPVTDDQIGRQIALHRVPVETIPAAFDSVQGAFISSILASRVLVGDRPATTALVGDRAALTALVGDLPAATLRMGDKAAAAVRVGDQAAATVRIGDQGV